MKAELRRMIYETGCEAEIARAIKRFEGWRLSDEAARHRVMQTLREGSSRHFSSDWIPIVVRFVAYHGGADLVSPLISEAMYEGRREADELERQGPKRAPKRDRQGRASA